jgi:hydroxymethylpyrimidine/phosphomethylpyrimidine kinase
MTARVLVIAGSDSGGGAGIQADIKTVTMLGGHAMTAITAITVQNTLGVQAVMPVPTETVIAQIAAVASDIGVDAVKIGMIGSAETANAVADVLEKMDAPVVFDPVMVATSGGVLADDGTIAAFERLARVATLVTPNLPELAVLSGSNPTTADEVLKAATDYAARLNTSVLVKGGHGEGDQVVDYLVEANGAWTRWRADRIDTNQTHGTGCTLASAIAVGLARGQRLKSAIVRARQFVRLAIKDAPGLGGGHGPMGHQSVRLDLGPGARLNQMTVGMTDYAASRDFYLALGLTQIVGTDDAHYARFEAAGGATLSIESGARPTLFFECEGLDAEVARLQDLGIVFDQLPTDREWLWREARLTDPAGNAICLYQAGENRRYPPWRIT